MFWSKGYDGVTIDDLVEGMGVGRPSLYAVFGDKRGYSYASLGRTQNGRALSRPKHSFRNKVFATRSRAF